MNDERYTPEHIFDAVRRFGLIGPPHIVSLISGSVTSKVLHRCMRESQAICWMQYRVKYGGDHGVERDSVLVYWGPDRSKFADAVRHLGPVFASEEL